MRSPKAISFLLVYFTQQGHGWVRSVIGAGPTTTPTETRHILRTSVFPSACGSFAESSLWLWSGRRLGDSVGRMEVQTYSDMVVEGKENFRENTGLYRPSAARDVIGNAENRQLPYAALAGSPKPFLPSFSRFASSCGYNPSTRSQRVETLLWRMILKSCVVL